MALATSGSPGLLPKAHLRRSLFSPFFLREVREGRGGEADDVFAGADG